MEVTVPCFHGCKEYGSQREHGVWVHEDPRLMHSEWQNQWQKESEIAGTVQANGILEGCWYNIGWGCHDSER